MFPVIETSRLILRPPVPGDVDRLTTRRSHPEVVVFNGPAYTRERSLAWIEGSIRMGGPQPDAWYLVAVDERETGTFVGDLALHTIDGGRTIEVGYSLDPDRWGRGFATEAVTAVVDWVFDELGVTRVVGMLHPDNRRSAMVLERCGFRFEGHTRRSYWLDGRVMDDLIYGMLPEDRDAWRARPTDPPAEVTLAPITPDTVREACRLAVHHSQESLVAPVAVSLAEAAVRGPGTGHEAAWHRLIEADGVPVGFVMVALPEGEDPDPYLWRLLVDRLHQRRGIAGRALDLVEEEMRRRGHTRIGVSWVDLPGGPARLYERRGYAPTGDIHEGEVVARKAL